MREIHVDFSSIERVETGVVKIVYDDDVRDWAAFFIRGDDAIGLSFLISQVEEHLRDKNKHFYLSAELTHWRDRLRHVVEGQGGS